MHVEKQQIEASMERKILTYALMNTKFLGAVEKVLDATMLKAPFAQTVWRWTKEFYQHKNEAPKEAIQDIYLNYRLTFDTKDEADTVGIFLQSLSDTYVAPKDVDWEIQQAIFYIRLRSVEILSDKLIQAVAHKDIQEAESIVSRYTKVDRIHTDTLDFTKLTHNQIENAFNMEEEDLFQLPGAFGALLGKFKRCDFVQLLAAAKAGKSFFMQYIGMWGMFHGLKVLELNYEMRYDQRIRRFWQCLTASPKTKKEVTWHYFDRESPLEDKWFIGTKTELREAVPLTQTAVEGFWDRFRKDHPTGDYKLQCHISKSHTVQDVRRILVNLETFENWKPDVLIIDHPALLKHDKRGGQSWQELGDLYAELRGLATEHNLLLVAASHSTREGYKASMLDETMVGKSIDILNHVTSCVALSGSKAEHAKGFLRAQQLAEREGQVFSDQVVISQCLDMAMPHVDSRWLSELTEYHLPDTMEKPEKSKFKPRE